MTTPIAKAMYNWIKGYREIKGAPLDRNDFVTQWGDLGNAVYDWSVNAYKQNLLHDTAGIIPELETVWEGAIGALEQKTPIGGQLGAVYGYEGQGKPSVQSPFGDLATQLLNFAKGTNADGSWHSRAQFQQLYGDLGGAVFDWSMSESAAGIDPTADPARWDAVVTNIALTKPPGGAIGSAYVLTPTPTQQQVNWQQDYQTKQAAATTAYNNAQLAIQQGNLQLAQQQLALAQQSQKDADDIAQQQLSLQSQSQNFQQGYQNNRAAAQDAMNNAQIALQQGNLALAGQQLTLAQKSQTDANAIAQQQLNLQAQGQNFQQGFQNAQFSAGTTGYYGGAPTLDRQRIEADIAATNARIKIAEEQGNADLALRERQRLDQLQIALGQQGMQEAGVTGYYNNAPTFARQQYETDLAANPRDWVKSWEYQRGKDPSQATNVPVPSWLKNVATNTPSAQFQGSAGGLGTFPIKPPDPNQVNAKTFNTLAPSEQEGLMGLASSSGWYVPDYIKAMQNSWTKQNINPNNNVWSGF